VKRTRGNNIEQNLFRRGGLRPRLQIDPEELPDPRRQIEGGNIAGYVEQLQAEEWHYVADDHQD
jgi:hypothetical protein